MLKYTHARTRTHAELAGYIVSYHVIFFRLLYITFLRRSACKLSENRKKDYSVISLNKTDTSESWYIHLNSRVLSLREFYDRRLEIDIYYLRTER